MQSGSEGVIMSSQRFVTIAGSFPSITLFYQSPLTAGSDWWRIFLGETNDMLKA